MNQSSPIWGSTENNKQAINVSFPNRLTPDDANYFPCDVRRMVWLEYVHVYGMGMRRFLGKETMDTLEEGKKRKIQLKILHNLLKYTFYAALLTLLYFILCAYHIIDPYTITTMTTTTSWQS